MKKEYCVYVHTNKANGKRYVGITSQKPQNRWRDGKGYLQNPHFKSAIEKYGWNSFEHDILITGLTKEQANRWEQALIAQWDSTNPDKGYNVGLGGEGTNSVSDKTREKMRVRNLKWYANHPEAKERRWHGVAQYDRSGNLICLYDSIKEAEQVTAVCYSSIVRCCNGRAYSAGGFRWMYLEEALLQMSEVNKWQRRKVAQYSIDGQFIRLYGSVVDAEKMLGLKHPSKISYVCSGQRKSCNGYIWKYIDKDIQDIISPYQNACEKRVCQYDKGGNIINVYKSATDAENKTGIKRENIYRVCRGERMSTGGYIWRYSDEIQDEAI